MSRPYEKKARLLEDITNIQQYKNTLEKDNFQKNEPHWRRVSKNTITLFQVLIDQDLKDLVNVLNHYPQYIEWVCEHFRYAYSYSENEADIDAASQLLHLGEPYFSKQFVRNVVRKLPKMEEMNLQGLSDFTLYIEKNHLNWHPIITNYLVTAVTQAIENSQLHPLQAIVLKKPLSQIELVESFIYDAQDRDAVLDIPYMN